MFYDAKNGYVQIGHTGMDYICFGQGKKVLILLPGLGDGVRTVKGTAKPFALMYRRLAKEYRVYVFSRRNLLPEHFSTRDMAKDIAEAMDLLEIHSAYVLGVSMGGMIAQYLAIDYPEKVDKLVLAVTLAKQNDTVQEALCAWKELAERGDYKGLMIDVAERSYSEKRLKRIRWMYSLLGNAGKPKNYQRFLVQLEACGNHDAFGELNKIKCPTLVIGGREDRIVTGRSSGEISGQIPDSRLHMYKELGHGAYEEARDFQRRIIAFCRRTEKPSLGQED